MFFIGLLASFSAMAQLSDAAERSLRMELFQKVNNLRIEHGATSLSLNDTLRAAAALHSTYMATNDVLSHEEPATDLETPFARVLQSGGRNFETIGENVLFSTPQQFPLGNDAVKILAEEMFQAWKKSPGHFANMINPEFEYGDFAFRVQPDKRIVFATHVFGKKGVSIPGQLSSKAFGLQEAPVECNLQFREFPNLIASLGNDLHVEGDEIKFYYYDIDYFKRIFQDPNDGLAVDLVSYRQLPCGTSNQLDISPIYDGVLLKPVFRDEMLRHNEARSDFRVITVAGRIPPGIDADDISPSMVLIQDGKKCRYLAPAYVPQRSYELRPIQPMVYDPGEIIMLKKGIVWSQQIPYEFNTNQIQPVKNSPVLPDAAPIAAVEITAFSSVEGDSVNNDRLHKGRAQYIRDHIRSQTGVADSLCTVSAMENWPYLAVQLASYGRENLASISHDSLKRLISSGDASLPWKQILYEQRISTATIHYSGVVSESGPSLILEEMTLRTAALNNQPALANKALYLMSLRDSLTTNVLFEKAVFEWCCRQPEIVTNYAAVLSRIYDNDLFASARFLFNWAYKSDELDENARFNLLYLYTLVSQGLLNDWDADAERLSNVIHPKIVNRLAGSAPLTPSMMLNLHLTYLQYYGQVNDARNISLSFDFVNRYFREHRLDDKDDVALVLFFNYWSMYNLTIDFLLPQFRRKELGEEGLFILAQTMNLYDHASNADEYLKILESAALLNPSRWCAWLRHDFQIMRDTNIKAMYCKKCLDTSDMPGHD